MNRHTFIYLIIALALPFLPSCAKGNGGAPRPDGDGGQLELRHARNLSLEQHDGYVKATIRNPWDTTKVLHTYLLVPDSISGPAASLPEGTVVRVPLKKALIYSSVHTSLIDELGAGKAIKGICDRQYILNPSLIRRIDEGDITDCGSSYSPVMEKIIQLSPDAVLLSPYENSGNYGKIGQMGIPIVECADYMESTPLGRTEWMKFYGMLFGREKNAEELFSGIETDYNRLKQLTDTISHRPKVLVDRLYGNTWYVPSANSTMGTYIKDAGAENPFASTGKAGSIGLSGEQVLHEAGDADIWIVRYGQASDKTMRELSDDHPLYSQFKAFKLKKVYGCNTEAVNYYEETPFHPHWLLRELIRVFHPELMETEGENRYFTPLKP